MKPSIYWLFVFVPITVILEHAGKVLPPVIFFSAALAIVPIAVLIVRSTEQIAARTGDAVGGLLNATFGNAPELIIALVALKAGYPNMVRASIIGGILANLLLGLGIAFFLGGIRHSDQKYNPAAARIYSSMMLLAAASLAVPSAFSRYFAPEGTIRQEELLNLGIAGVLLLTYGLYLLFSVKTHPGTFASVEGDKDEPHDDGNLWSKPLAIFGLAGASVLAAWMSEILVALRKARAKRSACRKSSSASCSWRSSAAPWRADPPSPWRERTKWTCPWASHLEVPFRLGCSLHRCWCSRVT